MRFSTRKTAKLNAYLFTLGTALLMSTVHANDITIQVTSPSYLDGRVVFPVNGDEISSLTHTFSKQGAQFNKACAFYGAVDADGQLPTQVTLDMTGFNLDNGHTLLVANVNAVKAGPTRQSPVPGQKGRFTETADCPSVTRLSFTARSIIKPGEQLNLFKGWDADNQERLELTAIAP